MMKKEYVAGMIRLSLVGVMAALLVVSSLMSGAVVRGQGESGERTPTKPKQPAKPKTPSKPKQPASTSRRTAGSKKPAASNSSNSEQVFWESIRNSSDPEDFREYLRKYPNGEFAGLARNRINTLTAAANNRSSNSNSTNSGSASASNAGRTTTRQSGPEIEMVRIPAGTFLMGSPDSESDRSSDEGPQHEVTVQSFYMGKYEVTQAQYRAVMGTNPSHFQGDNLPVENVSWNDAVEFCRKLSQMTGREYRLPTEAEWEYACRAGTTSAYAGNLEAMAWYYENAGDNRLSDASWSVDKLKANNNRTHPVGSKQANGFGLYDMRGNVREWCEDWYHASYNGAPSDGSAWLSGGEPYRVLRGGSWYNKADSLRSAYRYGSMPDARADASGFRVAASPRS